MVYIRRQLCLWLMKPTAPTPAVRGLVKQAAVQGFSVSKWPDALVHFHACSHPPCNMQKNLDLLRKRLMYPAKHPAMSAANRLSDHHLRW